MPVRARGVAVAVVIGVIVATVAGCDRKTPATDPAASASSPSSQAIPPPTSGAAASSPPPADAGPCRIAPEYRGEVAGLHVFARLGVAGAKVTGRYFYDRYGVDIPLSGTLGSADDVLLVEGPATSPSGRFEGRCEGSSGVLAGLWKKKEGAAGVAFRLVPIPPGEALVAATKRVTIKGPRPPPGKPQCKYEEQRLELFGLSDGAVARAMNQQGLEPRTEPMFDADDVNAVQGCAADGSDAVEASFSQTLVRSFRDLATITRGGYHMVAGAAHPESGIDFDLATFDLKTGARVAARDVLARDITDLLVACAAREHPESDGVQPYNGWQELAGNVDLTEKGVHFFAVGFPHFAGALTGQGPVIAYGVLLRDGYLRKDSPVKRAWESVPPAPKDAGPCPGPWE